MELLQLEEGSAVEECDSLGVSLHAGAALAGQVVPLVAHGAHGGQQVVHEGAHLHLLRACRRGHVFAWARVCTHGE